MVNTMHFNSHLHHQRKDTVEPNPQLVALIEWQDELDVSDPTEVEAFNRAKQAYNQGRTTLLAMPSVPNARLGHI